MQVTLDCSVDAASVPALARRCSLSLLPFLGRTVVGHALSGLVADGVRQVRILAVKELPELRRHIGQGEAWGLEIQYGSAEATANAKRSDRVVRLDRLPQLPQQPLWENYRGWFEAQQHLLVPFARERVGMREVAPGVFVGLRSQVAPDARLLGPCWIGANVFVGSRAILGPGSVIEDGSYIDVGAEIQGSVVGPQTYVGAYTELRDSFAWGSDLVSFDTGSATEVHDEFLLAEWRPRSSSRRSWFSGEHRPASSRVVRTKDYLKWPWSVSVSGFETTCGN